MSDTDDVVFTVEIMHASGDREEAVLFVDDDSPRIPYARIRELIAEQELVDFEYCFVVEVKSKLMDLRAAQERVAKVRANGDAIVRLRQKASIGGASLSSSAASVRSDLHAESPSDNTRASRDDWPSVSPVRSGSGGDGDAAPAMTAAAVATAAAAAAAQSPSADAPNARELEAAAMAEMKRSQRTVKPPPGLGHDTNTEDTTSVPKGGGDSGVETAAAAAAARSSHLHSLFGAPAAANSAAMFGSDIITSFFPPLASISTSNNTPKDALNWNAMNSSTPASGPGNGNAYASASGDGGSHVAAAAAAAAAAADTADDGSALLGLVPTGLDNINDTPDAHRTANRTSHSPTTSKSPSSAHGGSGGGGGGGGDSSRSPEAATHGAALSALFLDATKADGRGKGDGDSSSDLSSLSSDEEGSAAANDARGGEGDAAALATAEAAQDNAMIIGAAGKATKSSATTEAALFAHSERGAYDGTASNGGDSGGGGGGGDGDSNLVLCAACHCEFDRAHFSNKQLKRAVTRCKRCVERGAAARPFSGAMAAAAASAAKASRVLDTVAAQGKTDVMQSVRDGPLSANVDKSDDASSLRCGACHATRARAHFSRTQLKLSEGAARCGDCVARDQPLLAAPTESNTALFTSAPTSGAAASDTHGGFGGSNAAALNAASSTTTTDFVTDDDDTFERALEMLAIKLDADTAKARADCSPELPLQSAEAETALNASFQKNLVRTAATSRTAHASHAASAAQRGAVERATAATAASVAAASSAHAAATTMAAPPQPSEKILKCTACQLFLPIEAYSHLQWTNSSAARCKACVRAALAANSGETQRPRALRSAASGTWQRAGAALRHCYGCKEILPTSDFDAVQIQKNGMKASCVRCVKLAKKSGGSGGGGGGGGASASAAVRASSKSVAPIVATLGGSALSSEVADRGAERSSTTATNADSKAPTTSSKASAAAATSESKSAVQRQALAPTFTTTSTTTKRTAKQSSKSKKERRAQASPPKAAAPVPEEKSRACLQCEQDLPRANFSDEQWNFGSLALCRQCEEPSDVLAETAAMAASKGTGKGGASAHSQAASVAATKAKVAAKSDAANTAEQTLLRTCNSCKRIRKRSQYSNSQWNKSNSAASRCITCAQITSALNASKALKSSEQRQLTQSELQERVDTALRHNQITVRTLPHVMEVLCPSLIQECADVLGGYSEARNADSDNAMPGATPVDLLSVKVLSSYARMSALKSAPVGAQSSKVAAAPPPSSAQEATLGGVEEAQAGDQSEDTRKRAVMLALKEQLGLSDENMKVIDALMGDQVPFVTDSLKSSHDGSGDGSGRSAEELEAHFAAIVTAVQMSGNVDPIAFAAAAGSHDPNSPYRKFTSLLTSTLKASGRSEPPAHVHKKVKREHSNGGSNGSGGGAHMSSAAAAAAAAAASATTRSGTDERRFDEGFIAICKTAGVNSAAIDCASKFSSDEEYAAFLRKKNVFRPLAAAFLRYIEQKAQLHSLLTPENVDACRDLIDANTRFFGNFEQLEYLIWQAVDNGIFD